MKRNLEKKSPVEHNTLLFLNILLNYLGSSNGEKGYHLSSLTLDFATVNPIRSALFYPNYLIAKA